MWLADRDDLPTSSSSVEHLNSPDAKRMQMSAISELTRSDRNGIVSRAYFELLEWDDRLPYPEVGGVYFLDFADAQQVGQRDI